MAQTSPPIKGVSVVDRLDIFGPVGAPSGPLPAQVAGLAYVLSPADSGKTINFTNAAGCTVTIPLGLPPDFGVAMVQAGAGPVILAPVAGVSMLHPSNHTKSSAQKGVLALVPSALNTLTLTGATAA